MAFFHKIVWCTPYVRTVQYMYGSYHCILLVRFLTKIVKYIVSPIYKFLKWNCWHFLWNEMIFHHSSFIISSLWVKWNDISSLVFRFISWLVTRLRLVTRHEMKLKTREEMSFHYTQSDEITQDSWWNIISLHEKCQQ